MKRILTMAFALATLACGGSGDGGTGPSPSASIAGTYQLSTVNGAALPHTLYGVSNGPNGTNLTQLMAASLTVHSDGTYLANGTQEVWDGRNYSAPSYVASSGTYTSSGSGYSFTGGMVAGGAATLSGNTLTVTVSGEPYVFLR